MKLDSSAISLGTAAVDFTLPGVDGRNYSLRDVAGSHATLVAFICNHCPFVVHIVAGLVDYARDYQPKGVGVAAISANDVTTHPADSPERMAEFAAVHGFTFPYLFDESQAVAKSYKAVCTPDLFLYDRDLKLAYCGQFDASRPGRSDIPVSGDSLRAATDAVLAGRAVPSPQIPSSGCNIKWKPGNAPTAT
ncbi:MAG: thioredoxin family protein [Pseudomonadota bacterium]